MSDARWTEVDEDMAAAAGHLARSVELFAAGGFAGEELDAYRARMAFMHAMQSGHTSLEAALLRILDLLGEEAPSGRDWHADLIRRAARSLAGRPAILAPAVADAANETRRFRHVAMRSYGTFDPSLAQPAVAAAGLLAASLADAAAAFRRQVDPDEPVPGG